MKDETWVNPVGDDAIEHLRSLISEEDDARLDIEVHVIGAIIEAQKQNGLSPKQLGEMCGLSVATITHIESCAQSPRFDTLCKILVALGKKLDVVDAA